MFRVQFCGVPGHPIEEIERVIMGIAGSCVVEKEKKPDYWIFTVDPMTSQHEVLLKKALKTSGFNGCGLAVLGMKGWTIEGNKITLTFPDSKAANLFKSWLSHSEQHFAEWLREEPEYESKGLGFDFRDPGGDEIAVVEYDRYCNRDDDEG
jgi:hypothetical protein